MSRSFAVMKVVAFDTYKEWAAAATNRYHFLSIIGTIS